ncbi:MAG: YegS/Rv2252/BmrU family lipid kinase [Lachnospiraceae bacterium]|nr:YegS/Rv2252/BmrU family lipid kinase [Lachnospiraceae bacterium]
MYHIIVNPASRSGRGRLIWKETIKPALIERQIPYKAYFSKKAGDVARLAHKITSQADSDDLRLIILGGDGTVNETLQGISSFAHVVIGYIPTGSSNDLARDLGIPRDPLAALLHILSAEKDTERIRLMDRGSVISGQTKRSFAVSCGLGFDAAVCAEAMQSKIKDTLNKIGLGKLTYLGIALKQLFAARPVSCRLYLDEREPIYIKKFLFAAAMNHRYEGGGFKFCPDADDTDGVLDLCVVGNIPKIVILFALPTAFFGKHFLFPGVNHYSAEHVRLEASAPLWLHTDGEALEKTKMLEIDCHHGDIRFIV